MNSCDELKVSLYLDGELDPQGVVEVEKHLRQCRACRELLSTFSSLQEQLSPRAPVLAEGAPHNTLPSALLALLLAAATGVIWFCYRPSQEQMAPLGGRPNGSTLRQTLERENVRYQVETQGAQLLELEVMDRDCKLHLRRPQEKI